MGRYHELGGNDPFYPRWLLQSEPITIFAVISIFNLFFCGRADFQSYGFIVILLLIQGFKGEVITSIFFFDIYLLYLFSKRSFNRERAI